MSYQELLKEGRIKVHHATLEEIKSVLKIADRDLKFAKNAMAYNWDWAFAIAYNAALSASRAYMYKLGYRPISAESHKTVWRFMLLALPKEYHNRIQMRKRRHKAVYGFLRDITEYEAKESVKFAAGFMEEIVTFIEESKSNR